MYVGSVKAVPVHRVIDTAAMFSLMAAAETESRASNRCQISQWLNTRERFCVVVRTWHCDTGTWLSVCLIGRHCDDMAATRWAVTVKDEDVSVTSPCRAHDDTDCTSAGTSTYCFR